MVVVHRFKLLEPATGDWIVQIPKSTQARIEALGGLIIAGTAEEVDVAKIDDDGRYISNEP